MKSKSCNFYHTNTKNPGDNPGIFFDPYNTADFEWLRFTSTFACTPNFSQIESNVLPIILIQSSDFLYLSFKEKAKARSFSTYIKCRKTV